VREKSAELETLLKSKPKAGDDGSIKQTTAKRTVRNAPTEVAGTTQKLRQPLSRQERQELAADLRLLSGRDDGGLDLVGDSINKQP
jgi:hypothetical protein